MRPVWDDPDNEPIDPRYAIWNGTRYPVISRYFIRQHEGAFYYGEPVQKGWEKWYSDYLRDIEAQGAVLVHGDRQFDSLVAVHSERTTGIINLRLVKVLATIP